ncbi:hypothetical protein ACN6LA_001564 [Streptomyces sp. SAS_269]|uniref:hypothetical protein n=1 Tax=Streptomyces sp. SAS_269 TaxID=3412749 RepID=UPI00403CEA51
MRLQQKDRAVVRREREEQHTRQALSELALAGPREGDAAKVAARRPPHPAPTAVMGLPVGEGGALEGEFTPGAAAFVKVTG